MVSTEQRPQPEDEPATARPEGQPVPTQQPMPSKRRVGLLGTVALILLAIDIVTKVIVVATLHGSEPVRTLGGAVYLQLVRNPGAAFGMATGMTWVLALAAIAVVVVISWLARKLRSVGWAIGLGLILAGALGNLVDRIFRAPGPLQGHVVDFVSVFAPDGDVWPVFNVADASLCVGVALLVLLSVWGREYDGGASQIRTGGHGGTERAG